MCRDNYLKKNTKVILFLLVLSGFCLRMLYFDRITFFYDQARDAFESISILATHHLKILGPSTDIKGLHHGPLYWYMLSPIYYLTHGSVYAARLFLIVMSLLNIVLIYYFAKKLFSDIKTALISALFMAVSFETVQYSRWLSNPSPAFLTIGLFAYGIWLFMENNPRGLPLMLFC